MKLFHACVKCMEVKQISKTSLPLTLFQWLPPQHVWLSPAQRLAYPIFRCWLPLFLFNCVVNSYTGG